MFVYRMRFNALLVWLSLPLVGSGSSSACRLFAPYRAQVKVTAKSPRAGEQSILDLASAESAAGKDDAAFQTLTRGLRAHPSSARIAGALVVFLAGHGQMDDAYRLAEKFGSEYPRDLEAQKLYLRVLVATNDAAGRPLARRLLASSPHDSELLYLNGVLERKAGEYPSARSHLEQAIALTPAYAESHYNLGIALARLSDPRGATREFKRAIELGATEPEAHLELSKVLRTQGDVAQSDAQMQIYQAAIKANADHAIATSKAADAAQALAAGDAVKAVGLYREALEATPEDASLNYKLALALDRAGDLPGERAALEQSVKLDPKAALPQHQLGYLLYRSGDYDGAIADFRLAVADDPDFTQAWISLAATLAAKSQFAEAAQAIGHALLLEPHNTEALALKKQLLAARGGT